MALDLISLNWEGLNQIFTKVPKKEKGAPLILVQFCEDSPNYLTCLYLYLKSCLWRKALEYSFHQLWMLHNLQGVVLWIQHQVVEKEKTTTTNIVVALIQYVGKYVKIAVVIDYCADDLHCLWVLQCKHLSHYFKTVFDRGHIQNDELFENYSLGQVCNGLWF